MRSRIGFVSHNLESGYHAISFSKAGYPREQLISSMKHLRIESKHQGHKSDSIPWVHKSEDQIGKPLANPLLWISRR